jgi:hypothetical protein
MHRLNKTQQEAFIDLLHTRNLHFFDYETIALYTEWAKDENDREFYQFKIDFLTMELPKWIYELFNNLVVEYEEEYERS